MKRASAESRAVVRRYCILDVVGLIVVGSLFADQSPGIGCLAVPVSKNRAAITVNRRAFYSCQAGIVVLYVGCIASC